MGELLKIGINNLNSQESSLLSTPPEKNKETHHNKGLLNKSSSDKQFSDYNYS
jgi:hypothetical protein